MKLVLRVGLCLVAILACAVASASTRTIKFTNKNHNEIVDDLHVVFAQDTAVTTNPFGNDRQNGRTHNFWGMTVLENGSVTMAFSSTAVDLLIDKWWWTHGGNAVADGTQVGDSHDDTGGRELSVFDAPATGNGLLAVHINAVEHDFATTAGFSAAQTATALNTFLNGLNDNGFALINSVLLDARTDRFVGNLLGDPATELNVQVLQQDSTQPFTLTPIPEPSMALLACLGLCGVGRFIGTARSRRRHR